MISRRRFLGQLPLAAGAAATLAAAPSPSRAGRIPGYAPKLSDDGLHIQPFFLQSFLDMKDDLAEAARAGKRFAVVWEQKGCPYCREMHTNHFGISEIRDYVSKNFVMVQLNLWGSREVTDFDGKKMEERALARRWRVVFTPTINFFPATVAEIGGKSGRDVEVARLPGLLKPFHFLTMFQYVRENAYKKQGFQKFVQAKFAEAKKKGVDPLRYDDWKQH
jgi:thioredoxin-related protein